MKKALFALVAFMLLIGVVIAKFGWHSTTQVIQGVFEKPEKAGTANVIVYQNSSIEFSYPGNWRIDKEDPDYDPETYFDINPPGNGKLMIMIENRTLAFDSLLDNLYKSYSKIMPRQKKQVTTAYGNIEGTGLELRGHMLVADGLIRIFATHFNKKTLVIIEQRYDEDEAYNREGYELVEKTLRIKP